MTLDSVFHEMCQHANQVTGKGCLHRAQSILNAVGEGKLVQIVRKGGGDIGHRLLRTSDNHFVAVIDEIVYDANWGKPVPEKEYLRTVYTNPDELVMVEYYK